MNKQEQALKLAREALMVATTPLPEDRQAVLNAIEAIDAALQPAEQPEDERERFEAWHKSMHDCSDYARRDDDSYEDWDIQISWNGWQAAKRDAAQAPQKRAAAADLRLPDQPADRAETANAGGRTLMDAWNDGADANVMPQKGVCISPLATRPILYTDTINGGQQAMRDDLWAVTTVELNALHLAQPTAAACQPAEAAAQSKQDARDAAREGWKWVPIEPTERQWGGLARDIVMWLDMVGRTPRHLFKHLKMLGRDIPKWLRDESEMKNLDHVPSKGSRAAIIYRAMIEDAAPDSTPTADKEES